MLINIHRKRIFFYRMLVSWWKKQICRAPFGSDTAHFSPAPKKLPLMSQFNSRLSPVSAVATMWWTDGVWAPRCQPMLWEWVTRGTECRQMVRESNSTQTSGGKHQATEYVCTFHTIESDGFWVLRIDANLINIWWLIFFNCVPRALVYCHIAIGLTTCRGNVHWLSEFCGMCGRAAGQISSTHVSCYPLLHSAHRLRGVDWRRSRNHTAVTIATTAHYTQFSDFSRNTFTACHLKYSLGQSNGNSIRVINTSVCHLTEATFIGLSPARIILYSMRYTAGGMCIVV